jgi:hypothetical protein
VDEPRVRCVCCGLSMGVVYAPCGHPFCFICEGRGHDEDCGVCAGEFEGYV